MADGSFRHVFRDEEHHREEFLDRQLEVGWEEDPADRALEPERSTSLDPLGEAGDEAGPGLRPWRRHRAASSTRRSPARTVSVMRRNRTGS